MANIDDQIQILFSRMRTIEILLAFIAGAQLLNVGQVIVGFLK